MRKIHSFTTTNNLVPGTYPHKGHATTPSLTNSLLQEGQDKIMETPSPQKLQ